MSEAPMTERTDESTEAEAPDHTEGEGSVDMHLGGTRLSDDELAAVLAVIGRLAGSEPVNDRGQGTAGPTNRARYRRRRLGLHERHGADAWQFAAGVR
ncbi:MAG: hypothetical protein Q4F53_05905 [Nesterenkonia sp.]|nr:hypothetical protein [Nesterenkonia sp.]